MEQSVALQQSLPTGMVTFLFSDIEGSTERWERHREAMRAALRRHDDLLRESIERHRGHVFKTMGDQFCAAFSQPSDAIAAAADAQKAIGDEDWSAIDGLLVRMAIHSGVTDERNGDYYGPAVNRVARLLAVGHGRQVILSGFTADLIRHHLTHPLTLRDLGTHHLKGLAQPERVFQVVSPGAPQSFPELRTSDAPNNLPLELTLFLGREREVSSIVQHARTHRLVTLIGPGGVGKTRTALRSAASLLSAFPGGAWFVDLAAVADAQLVPSAIAQALHIGDVGGSGTLIENIVGTIAESDTLLVLDNCEHVIAAAAGAAQRILSACPNARVLATSREPLGIGGEHLFRMPSLAEPDAVALFVDRAEAAVGEFKLTRRNAPIVADIVRRLDGIPLAIELAAPKLRVLQLDEISKRLDERFELLAGGSRTALPRQQTLRALIDWSYDLLDDSERALLQQIAVFPSSWTLEAACAVCGEGASEPDVLRPLSRLVDKSLVSVEQDGVSRRYRMLETTRQYALERLNERAGQPAVAARHCAYFRDLSDRIFATYWTTNLDVHLAAARAELENYRVAIAYGLTDGNDVISAARIIANLREVWITSFNGEGRALVERALHAVGTSDSSTLARLLVARAALFWEGGLGLEAATEGTELARREGDPVLLADSLRWLGNAIGRTGRLRDALKALHEGVAVATPLGLPRLTAMVLNWEGFCFASIGENAAGQRSFERALALLRAVPDPTRLPTSLVNYAELKFNAGDVAAAIALNREALALVREYGNEAQLTATSLNLAAYELAAGKLDEAWALSREALEGGRRSQRPMAIAIAIQHLAQIAVRRGNLEGGARLMGFVDAAYAREKHARQPTEQSEYDRIAALLRNAYAPSRLAALTAEGASLEEPAAIALALAVPKPVDN
jgi:predicted ATPase/class 3 adenylate cyclase